MLNLHQIHIFVVCVEQGSFSSAGRKLGKAQSVISQTIANLEVDLNQTLFDRSSRSPTLTDAGERLLQYARSVLEQAQEMEQVAHSLSKGVETEIVLGIDSALLIPAFTDMLCRFRTLFNATRLEVQQIENHHIVEKVKTGQVQLGLMLLNPALDIGVEQSCIGNLGFLSVAHPNHPLAQLKDVSRKELSCYTQILHDSKEAKNLANAPLLSPDRISCNSFQLIAQLAISSLGWAYLPFHIAQPLIKSGMLVELDIIYDSKIWQMPVDRVTKLGSFKGPALNWLYKESENLFV